jgi:hypothetical protein
MLFPTHYTFNIISSERYIFPFVSQKLLNREFGNYTNDQSFSGRSYISTTAFAFLLSLKMSLFLSFKLKDKLRYIMIEMACNSICHSICHILDRLLTLMYCMTAVIFQIVILFNSLISLGV